MTSRFFHVLLISLPTSLFAIDETKGELTLFSPDNYAKVYYTTDGSEPGPKTKIYKKPIETKKAGLVKAVCVDINSNISDCISIDMGALQNLQSIK